MSAADSPLPGPVRGRVPRSRSGALADRHHSYAGLVSRCLALAVDVTLVAVAAAALASLPALVWRELTRGNGDALAAGTAFAATLLPWVYFTVAWWLGGRTVGALVFGLVLTRPDGERLGVVRAGLRAAVGLMFAPLWVVGMVSVVFDRQRRALHDRLFGTVVRYRAGPDVP